MGGHVVEAIALLFSIGAITEVPLADIGGSMARVSKSLGQCCLVLEKAIFIVNNTVLVGIPPGQSLTTVR